MGAAPSSGDYALSQSDHLAVQVKDCMILIGWLSDRVMRLGEQFGMLAEPLPELAPQMHGFACYPRRNAAVLEARKQIAATQRPPTER